MTVVDAGVAPRIMLVPEFATSAGAEATELAALAGLVLDPWQAFVLEQSMGELPDGRWAASEVGLCVPRQNGKNAILEARELAGLFLLGEDLLIHSAQQFKTAKEHFLRLLSLIEFTPDFSKRVKKVVRTHGEEGIELLNGQRILFMARTKSSARGFTAPFVAFDEAMFLAESSMGAMIPTQSAVPNRQRWYTGSSVDQNIHTDGVVFARVRDRAINQTDPRLAYFEHSVDADNPAVVTDDQFASPDEWQKANPGMGIRISDEAILDELRSLDRRTFAVERLGVGDWPDIDGNAQAIISQEDWAAIANPDGKIVGPVCFAFDVSPERGCAIAVCGQDSDGNQQIEIIRQQAGTGWVVAELGRLDEVHNPQLIVCDGFGPVLSLLPALEDAGVKVTTMNSTDHGQACGLFVDAVNEQTVRHLGSLELRNAVKGAAVRPLGDAFAFSRKNSHVDISPLVAATFAHWASATNGILSDWKFY